MQWDKCRRVLVAEMTRQGITRAEMVRRAGDQGLRPSTVYGALWPSTIGQPYLGTVTGLLGALGKSFAWLEKEVKTAPDDDGPAVPAVVPAPSPAPQAKKRKAKV